MDQFHKPTYGKITQGTIFRCARSIRYHNCEVFGLAITARCDVAQHKYPILNFLPVVHLCDWLRRDGLDILVEEEKSDQHGQLREILRQANVSEVLLSSVPLQKIADVHFPIDAGNRVEKSRAEKVRKMLCLSTEFENVLSNADPEEQFQWFRNLRPKKVKELVRRLSKHSVLGHYFFEGFPSENTVPTGFVCLLREVATLSKVISEEIGKGLSSTKYEELCDGDPNSGGLYIPKEDLAMPIVQVASPTIEHVLQSFSHLFGRIGVEDPNDDVISNLIQQTLNLPEGAQL